MLDDVIKFINSIDSTHLAIWFYICFFTSLILLVLYALFLFVYSFVINKKRQYFLLHTKGVRLTDDDFIFFVHIGFFTNVKKYFTCRGYFLKEYK